MSDAEPQVRATMLAGLGGLLAERYGLDLGDLLIEAGLNRDQLPDPSSTVSLNAYACLLEIAARRTCDDCFGLHFARAFPRGGTRALGYLILNAPDLGTCLEHLSRYVRLQTDAVEFELEEGLGTADFKIKCSPALVAPRRQFVEFIAALVALRLSSAFGRSWVPIRVEFEHRAPKCCDDYRTVFGRRLCFDRPQTAMTLSADRLQARNPQADERLFALLKDVADGELARIDKRQDLIWVVNDYLVANLGDRRISLEGAAQATGLKPRQLQTELKRLGTTFEEQLSQMRRTLADRLLRDSDLAMTEIALKLGFSEPSAFTRAVRAWHGMPPSQWRREARGATEAAAAGTASLKARS